MVPIKIFSPGPTYTKHQKFKKDKNAEITSLMFGKWATLANVFWHNIKPK